MPDGTAIARPWVVVMRDGTVAIDWGDGLFQEAISGSFFKGSESQVSHNAQDSDLDWLIRVGRVADFDSKNVYFVSLPDRVSKSLE